MLGAHAPNLFPNLFMSHHMKHKHCKALYGTQSKDTQYEHGEGQNCHATPTSMVDSLPKNQNGTRVYILYVVYGIPQRKAVVDA